MCEATDSVSPVRGKSHTKDSSELCLFNLRNAVQTYTHSPQFSSGYSIVLVLVITFLRDAKFQEAVVVSQQSRSGPRFTEEGTAHSHTPGWEQSPSTLGANACQHPPGHPVNHVIFTASNQKKSFSKT